MLAGGEVVEDPAGERPAERLPVEQAAMQPFVAAPEAASMPGESRWPRYTLQRSPREYDAVLAEVAP